MGCRRSDRSVLRLSIVKAIGAAYVKPDNLRATRATLVSLIVKILKLTEHEPDYLFPTVRADMEREADMYGLGAVDDFVEDDQSLNFFVTELPGWLDNTEIIQAVHERPAPMIPATARLTAHL